MDRKLAACEAIDTVRKEGAVINLTPESCNCIGGKYYLGLAPVPRDQIIRVIMDIHKMFTSEQLAQQKYFSLICQISSLVGHALSDRYTVKVIYGGRLSGQRDAESFELPDMFSMIRQLEAI